MNKKTVALTDQQYIDILTAIKESYKTYTIEKSTRGFYIPLVLFTCSFICDILKMYFKAFKAVFRLVLFYGGTVCHCKQTLPKKPFKALRF